MGKNYFKNRLKYFLPLMGFIFGLFLFLLPSVTEASGVICFCGVGGTNQTACCSAVADPGSDVCNPSYDPTGVGWWYNSRCPGSLYWASNLSDSSGTLLANTKVGLIGNVPYNGSISGGINNVSCLFKKSSDLTTSCKMGSFAGGGNNGQDCSAGDRSGLSPCYSPAGKWDWSQSQCVECNGLREGRVLGDTSDNSIGNVCSNVYPQGTNYGKCESGCGASWQCDEQAYGSATPVTGGICNNCVYGPYPDCETACQDAGYYDGICTDSFSSYVFSGRCYYSPTTKSGTICSFTCYCINRCSICSGAKTYNCIASGCSNAHCVKDSCGAECDSNNDCSSNSCNLSTCECECVGEIDAYPESDYEPCDYTIDIYNINSCQGLTWEVTRDGSLIDSGTVGSDTDWNETVYDYGRSADSSIRYELYIGDDPNEKDYDTVSCSGEVCTRDDPYVSISPSSQSGSPGEQKSYTVTVINYDTSVCGSSLFDLNVSSCPSGWTCSLSANSITISPDGSSGSVALYVTSASGATSGTYTIKVKATNSGATSYYDEGSTNYVIGCNCTGWTNQSCGYSTCDSYHMGKTRTCTPSDCDSELECFCDESCCTTWADQGCGPTGGCADTEMYQTRTCGSDCVYSTSRCVSDPACGAVGITPPSVTTNPADPVAETSATLNAILNDMGGASSVIVWFEWGLTPAMGNKTLEQTKYSADSFWENLSGLTPGTIYYFEAFAKNGGSW